VERFKQAFAYALAIMALLSLFGAIYQAMTQQPQSAAILGALFLAAAFLFYLPQLETFKAFMVEVRLRQSVDRAEEIIERLRQVFIVNAKTTYMTLAWGNRWGSPKATEKQTLLDDVDQQLRALNVSDVERRAISDKFVAMIGIDLYVIYLHIFERYVAWKNSNQRTLSPAERQKLSDEINKWRRNLGHPGRELATYDLMEHLQRATPIEVLDADHRPTAEKFRSEILALHTACREKGGFTLEAAQFCDRYRDETGQSAKVKELFGSHVNL